MKTNLLAYIHVIITGIYVVLVELLAIWFDGYEDEIIILLFIPYAYISWMFYEMHSNYNGIECVSKKLWYPSQHNHEKTTLKSIFILFLACLLGLYIAYALYLHGLLFTINDEDIYIYVFSILPFVWMIDSIGILWSYRWRIIKKDHY